MSNYRISPSRVPGMSFPHDSSSGMSIAPGGGFSAPVLNLCRLYIPQHRAILGKHRIRRDACWRA
jgi:hypothetical protein